MGDKEFLNELAAVLNSRPTHSQGDTPHIRIDAVAAQEIASRLREIGNRILVH